MAKASTLVAVDGLSELLPAVKPTDKVAFDGGEFFKKETYDAIGALIKDYEIFHNLVLVAKFQRQKMGSILVSDATRQEDRYQGKVGLVLKVAPGAFVDEPGATFYGVKVKIDDWVVYRQNDGIDQDIVAAAGKKINCRLLQDSEIKGRITRPDLVW